MNTNFISKTMGGSGVLAFWRVDIYNLVVILTNVGAEGLSLIFLWFVGVRVLC